MLDEKNIDVLTKHGVYSRTELESRCETKLEIYIKNINIEARTMIEMITKDIIPAVSEYIESLSDAALSKKSFISSIDTSVEEKLAVKLSKLNAELYEKNEILEEKVNAAFEYEADIEKCAMYFREEVFEAMNDARKVADELEVNTARDFWPFPTYGRAAFRHKIKFLNIHKNVQNNLSCTFFYFLDFGLNMQAHKNPKNTAADIPHAAAFTPPHKAPHSPFSFIAVSAPFASVYPNPIIGTVAPQPAYFTMFSYNPMPVSITPQTT